MDTWFLENYIYRGMCEAITCARLFTNLTQKKPSNLNKIAKKLNISEKKCQFTGPFEQNF